MGRAGKADLEKDGLEQDCGDGLPILPGRSPSRRFTQQSDHHFVRFLTKAADNRYFSKFAVFSYDKARYQGAGIKAVARIKQALVQPSAEVFTAYGSRVIVIPGSKRDRFPLVHLDDILRFDGLTYFTTAISGRTQSGL